MRRREFSTLVGGAAVTWPFVARAQKSAKVPGIGVLWHAGSADEEGTTFTELVKGFEDLGYIQGRNVILEGLAFTYGATIAKLAVAPGIALSVWARQPLEAGALISYGADPDAIFRRAAVYVDKVLKGSKPSELPVQGPTKFQLIINLKTAKALGLTIAPSLLAPAAEVIE